MPALDNYVDDFERVILLSDHANRELAEEIYGFLKKKYIHGKLKDYNPNDLYLNIFKNGEVEVKLNTNVRGRHVFVLKSTNVCKDRWKDESPLQKDLVNDVNQSYIELFLINDALKRSSAESITNILPFMPYQRQDKKDEPRVPISASCLGTILTQTGATRVVNFNPHSEQIQGFYDIPFDALYAEIMFAEYFHTNFKNLEGMSVWSPDAGGAKRANKLGKWLGLPVGIGSKERPRPGEISKIMIPQGYNIKGNKTIILDDMADSCGSLVRCAQGLMDLGAEKVYACIAHPILTGDAKEKLYANNIDLITTNTIPIKNVKEYPNIKVISIGYMISEAISSICTGDSISTHLFNYKEYKAWKSSALP